RAGLALSGNAARDLRLLFEAKGANKRRGRAPIFRVTREETLWGERFPEEVRALLSLQESHGLGNADLNDYRPFFFKDQFFYDGEDAAPRLFADARKMYWPVYYAAHFWGVYPIGGTNGGDYYLASLEPGRRHSRVYRYDHEELLLAVATRSITELVW